MQFPARPKQISEQLAMAVSHRCRCRCKVMRSRNISANDIPALPDPYHFEFDRFRKPSRCSNCATGYQDTVTCASKLAGGACVNVSHCGMLDFDTLRLRSDRLPIPGLISCKGAVLCCLLVLAVCDREALRDFRSKRRLLDWPPGAGAGRRALCNDISHPREVGPEQTSSCSHCTLNAHAFEMVSVFSIGKCPNRGLVP